MGMMEIFENVDFGYDLLSIPLRHSLEVEVFTGKDLWGRLKESIPRQ
jgi:hypothetical protein